jgi:homoserine O-acetyltransferase
MNPDHPAFAQPAPDVFRATFETSEGAFTMEVHRDWAPRGVDRFYHLARLGFYDDQRIFRVRAGFIAQFGIPGDTALAAVWRDRTLADDSVRASNARGRVAYAMTGPDTRTTQLYINYSDDNVRLDADGFAPIGEIIDGMDAVDRFYSEYDESAGGGMRGGLQGPVFSGGNAYLDRHYPELDRIIRVTVATTSQ